ncbi:MAG: hypothetical protein VX822_03035 [Candidatus Neomarinimicrobiota bacterium]|nr:hypothetical protein [Candidatus Neomarinimicrobiota bacterium]
MDVGYWIFILIAYLVSQWLRKRAQSFRQPPPQEQPMKTPPKRKKEGIPEFLRNLGLDEMFEEIKSEIRPQKVYDEMEGVVKEAVELGEDFEILDDETIIEPETLPESDGVFEEETIHVWAPAIPLGRKETASHPIHAYLKNRSDLRNVILMKEILGPPRAIERHRFRPYF